ncbi:signaling protein [Sphingosinithalassobacter tenebrarum]|uniref:Signaling protein n=2 Tax=Stakelama tenebrarum TaxID=2711215 RepID=A0A6G6YA67_9SPHN|nr:signaling protein [Sphingosinithalassobacter tenebrarum]
MQRFALSPRQARIALTLLTGAVVVSLAFALAGLTWRIAGHAGTGAITVPSGGASAPAPDIAPALALAPFGKPAVGEATQRTGLPLELKGVVAAIPASLSTAYISVEGAPAESFAVGDRVSGSTIRSILRDRVVIENGGRVEALYFPDPTLSPEQRQAQASAPASGPAPSAPDAANPAALLQRFDATPTEQGLRIGDSPPPGLQPGDVIETVNGAAVNDPASAAAAIQGAQASGNASVTVNRQGTRLTITMPIR